MDISTQAGKRSKIKTPDFVEIKIVNNWGGPPAKRMTECHYVRDQLAVTTSALNDKEYCVTHLPTGHFIEPKFTNKRLAKKFCNGLSELYDWKKISSPDKVKRLHVLKKKVAQLRRRLKIKKEKP